MIKASMVSCMITQSLRIIKIFVSYNDGKVLVVSHVDGYDVIGIS